MNIYKYNNWKGGMILKKNYGENEQNDGDKTEDT